MAQQRISLSLSIMGAGSDTDEYASIFDAGSVFSMDLKEKISGPYEAILKVFTKKPLSRSLLKALSGKDAVVNAGYSDEKGNLERAVEGTVKECIYYGRLLPATSDEKQSCSYHYELKLVSPFEAMKLSVRTKTFDILSPVTVIKNIIENYGVKLYVDDSLLDKKYFDKTLIYEQIDESDYDFIHKLMVMYGLNYAFVHDNDKGKPSVYLSRACGASLYRGSSLTVSGPDTGLTLSNSGEKPLNTDLDAIISCSLYGESEDGVLNLETLKCASTDGYSNKSQSDLQKILPQALSYFTASKMLYSAARTRERRRLNENLQARLTRDTSVYQGKTSSLKINPGSIMCLDDFYDDEKIYTLVTSSSLYVEQPAPEDRAFTIDTKSTVKTEFTALELASVGGSGLNGPITGELKTSDEFDNSINLGSFAEYDFTTGSDKSGSEFVEAVVSDGSGCTTGVNAGSICIYADDNTEEPSMFYAVTENASEPVVVTVTYGTQKGSEASFSRLPRIGQRVLLCRRFGRYYLQGYLPEADSLYVFDSNNRSLKFGADIKYYTSPASQSIWSRDGKKMEKLSEPAAPECGDVKKQSESSSISMENIGNEKEYILSKIYRREIDDYFDLISKQHNDRSYVEKFTEVLDGETSSYSSQCSQLMEDLGLKEDALKEAALSYYDRLGELDGTVASFDVTQDIDAYSSGLDETLDKLATDYKNKKTSYLGVCEDIDSLADKIISNTGIHYDESEEDGVKVITTEAFKIKSIGGVEINAQTGDITLNTDGEINIKAGKGITLDANSVKIVGKNLVNAAVGGNALSISKNAAALKAKKWTTCKGIFDAGISFDSIAGTVITGMNVNIGAALTASMSDNLGAKISTNYGVASLTGNSTLIGTNTRRQFIFNFTQSVGLLLNELANMGFTLGGVDLGAKITKSISYAVPSTIGTALSVYKGYQGIRQAQGTFNKIMAYVSAVLNFVSSLYDTVMLTIISTDATFLSESIGKAEKITKQDAIRLGSLVLKLSIMAATVVTYVVEMDGKKKCSLSMQGKTLSLEAGAVKKLSNEFVEAVSAMAGKDVAKDDRDNARKVNDLEQLNDDSEDDKDESFDEKLDQKERKQLIEGEDK